MKPVNQLQINASKLKGMGDYPSFIHLGLRHLQKELPTGSVGEGGATQFIVPLDLLRMTVSPALLVDIEEVSVGFKKG